MNMNTNPDANPFGMPHGSTTDSVYGESFGAPRAARRVLSGREWLPSSVQAVVAPLRASGGGASVWGGEAGRCEAADEDGAVERRRVVL